MISDSSPIIFLSKINKLWFFQKLFNFVIITDAVRQEILINTKPGYFAIENAIEKGWIKIINPNKNPDFGIGQGENSIINLARERKDTIIMDDIFAINIAKAYNIPIIRTTTLLFLAIRKKIITKQEATILFNQLIDISYYISPKEYAIILDKLKTN